MAGGKSKWMLVLLMLIGYTAAQSVTGPTTTHKPGDGMTGPTTPYEPYQLNSTQPGDGMTGPINPYEQGDGMTGPINPYEQGGDEMMEETMNPYKQQKQLKDCQKFYEKISTDVMKQYPALQDLSMEDFLETPEWKAFILDDPAKIEYIMNCQAASNWTMNQNEMTSTGYVQWFMEVSKDAKNLKNMLDPKKGLSKDMIPQVIMLLIEMKITQDPQYAGALQMLVEDYAELKGGFKSIPMDELVSVGPAIVSLMPAYEIDYLPQDILDLMYNHIANETKKMHDGLDFDASATTFYMLKYDKNRFKAFCRNAFNKKLNAENFQKLAIWLPCAENKICGKVDASLVQNNLEVLSNLPWACYDNENQDAFGFEIEGVPDSQICGKKLAKAAVDPKGPKPVLFDTIDDMENLNAFRNCFETKYWIKTLKLINCTMVKFLLMEKVFPKKVKGYAIDQCVSLPAMSAINCDTIGEYSLALAKLKPSKWKKIPDSVLCDMKCISVFTSIPNLPQKVKSSLMTKCYGKKKDKSGNSPAKITKEQIQQLGSMITELPMNQMKEISADDIALNIEEIKSKLKSNKGKGKSKVGVLLEIAKKMAKANKFAEISDSKEMMKQMSLKDLKQAALSGDIEADLGLNGTKEMGLTGSQQKWVMSEILKKKTADSFSADEIKSKGALVKGFLSSDIKVMCKDKTKDQMEFAVALCAQSGWPLKPLQKIKTGLMANGLLFRNSTHPMSALTTLDVSELGCECLMYYESTELEAMKTEVCSAVCGKVGYCDRFRCVNPTQRSNGLQACLECLGLGAALMTEIEYDTLGPNMIAQLSATQLSTLVPISVLLSNIGDLKGMCMPQELREAVATALVKEFGGSGAGIDAYTIMGLGSAIMLLPANIQAQLDKAAVAEIAATIMSELHPETDEEKDLKKCCKMWLSDADKADLHEHKKATKLAVKNAIISTMAALRRKRATLSWTCVNVQIIQDSFTTVPDEEITAMDGTEFQDCLADMGQFTTWTDAKKTLLLSKAETVLGTKVCDFSSTDITDLGEISTALTTENIACMPLDIQDVVSSFGSISNWTPTQLAAFASAYKTANGLTDLTSISSADVIVLGNLLCGFDVADLAGIPISTIAESGTQIGSLSECPVPQLAQLKTLATDASAYGPVADWTAAEMQELKYIIAGLDGTEIQALSTTSLEGMIPEVVSKIPADVLKMLSTAQLEAFTEAQAISVTDTQKAALTEAQVTLLGVITSGGQQLVEEVTAAPGLTTTTTAAAGAGVKGTGLLTIAAIWISWIVWS